MNIALRWAKQVGAIFVVYVCVGVVAGVVMYPLGFPDTAVGLVTLVGIVIVLKQHWDDLPRYSVTWLKRLVAIAMMTIAVAFAIVLIVLALRPFVASVADISSGTVLFLAAVASATLLWAFRERLGL